MNLDLARELKKAMEYEGDGDTNRNRCPRNDPKRLGKRTGRVGNQRTSSDHRNYNFIEISQNTERSH